MVHITSSRITQTAQGKPEPSRKWGRSRERRRTLHFRTSCPVSNPVTLWGVGKEKQWELQLRPAWSVPALKQELLGLTTLTQLVAFRRKTPTPGGFAA